MSQRVIEAINATIHEWMTVNPDAHFIGEDILDPYGGAFKASRGLSTSFPERVISTPISEAGIVGFANGLALRGKPAMVEIMFGDFSSLIFDQLLNHAAKYRWMYNEQVHVPLIVRTPMGGRRGYGPTHSQSIEKHFCGIPGLTVLCMHQYGATAELYAEAFKADGPVLMIENKTLYSRLVEPADLLPRYAAPDAIILTYGGTVEHAVKAAKTLHDIDELQVEVVAVTQLSPMDHTAIAALAKRCKRFLAVEEGTPGWGFAQECAYALVNEKVTFQSLASANHPIPSSRAWEDQMLPSADAIHQAVLGLL